MEAEEPKVPTSLACIIHKRHCGHFPLAGYSLSMNRLLIAIIEVATGANTDMGNGAIQYCSVSKGNSSAPRQHTDDSSSLSP